MNDPAADMPGPSRVLSYSTAHRLPADRSRQAWRVFRIREAEPSGRLAHPDGSGLTTDEPVRPVDRRARGARRTFLQRLDERLLGELRRLERAEASLTRTEAGFLGALSRREGWTTLGFSSLAALARERLGMAAHCAYDLARLDAAFRRCPPLERGFLAGTFTLSHALALEPLLRRRRVEPEEIGPWIERASQCTVEALKSRVRSFLREPIGIRRSPLEGADGAEESPAASEAGSTGVGRTDAAIEEEEDRELGRVITMRAPIVFTLDLKETFETARKVIGRDAPTHECMEAILAEARAKMGPERGEAARVLRSSSSSNGSPASNGASASNVASSSKASSGSRTAGPSFEIILGDHEDLDRPPLGGARNLPGSPWDDRRGLVPRPVRRRENGQGASDADPAATAAHLCGSEAANNRSTDAKDLLHSFRTPLPLSLADAARTMEAIRQHLEAVEELAELLHLHGSREAQRLVDAIQTLRQLKNPLRVLRVRLLWDFEQTGALHRLGYRKLEELVTHELRVSASTARNMRQEREIFHRFPSLETAYAEGAISLSNARRISRLATVETAHDFIRRAAEVTDAQFAREIELRSDMEMTFPGLSPMAAFPDPDLEGRIIGQLLRLGDTGRKIEGELRDHGVAGTFYNLTRRHWRDRRTPEDAVRKGYRILSEGRLDALIERHRMQSADGVQHDWVEETPSSPLTTPDLEALFLSGALPRDPARDPISMRRLEILLARLIRTRCGRSQTFATRTVKIRFWLPGSVAEEFDRTLKRAARECLPADFVRKPVPVWMPLALVCEAAMSEWQEAGLRYRGHRWRMLERDRYRCQVPGCTRRCDLHGHHGIHRADSGPDALWNMISLCAFHHAALHDGRLRVYGIAPWGLVWIFSDGKVYAGNLLVGTVPRTGCGPGCGWGRTSSPAPHRTPDRTPGPATDRTPDHATDSSG